MRKKLIITAVLASVMVMCFAQKPHKIMFYNMENFFDTIDDPETNDEEFLPDGAKRWNTAKYDKKLRNMERVLFDIAAIDRNYPAVIGVSEIENRSILEDIASTRKLLPARYAICHYDSPDLRGVDVAFLYRPDVFKLEGSADIPVRIASLPNWRTRGIVTMWGTIDDEPFLFMVAHWPSRLGGQAASAFKRNAAAEQMRAIADSVLKVNPATKIVAMGDFNDDPTDESVEVHLGAKAKIKELQLRRHAQSRSGNARLPRRMEPLRQYRRFGEPRYRFRRQTETRQGPVQKDQILRQYLQTLLPHPAGGAV